MPIRYRKQDEDGDYVFGQSALDFYTGNEAVGQAIKTRLELDKGSFWRDLNAGLAMSQQILGSPGSEANIAIVNSLIQQRILGTQDVESIVQSSVTYNRETREYSYSCTVQTAYSETVLVEGAL